jgi:hypothetical protein
MTNALVSAPVPHDRGAPDPHPGPGQAAEMVLDLVVSPHSKRNYAKALDDLFAFCASQPLPGPY